MKNILQLIFISLLLLTFSCKEKKSKPTTGGIEEQAEQKVSVEQPKKSVTKKKELPKHYEYKYVIARSGLNYRDIPNGTVLGKFPLNTRLKIIEYTKISDKIKDNDKTIEGEWVGVEKRVNNKNTDTVYVFNGFLSNSYVQSDIKLYVASTIQKETYGKTKSTFLNLSETYFRNTYEENEDRTKNLILNKTDLTKDVIELNNNQRKKLINKLELSESDKVFVYNIKNDKVISFTIKDLSAIACMNPYGPSNEYKNDEFDYMLGLDLGKKIIDGEKIVYIGKVNPFQVGKMKPMIWNKTDNYNFPIQKAITNNETVIETYYFRFARFKYFIQSHKLQKKNYNYIKKHHLVIIDTIKKSIISNREYNSSESIDLIPVYTTNKVTEHYNNYFWTGELFKNKPPILYGLESHSFGCPEIDFITNSEPSIPILCDNRH